MADYRAMYTYQVIVTVVDYYGYPVYIEKPTYVGARDAAEAKRLVQRTYGSWPRTTATAKRAK